MSTTDDAPAAAGLTIERDDIVAAIEAMEFGGTNATYAQAPPAKEFADLDLVQGFQFGLAEDVPVRFIGGAGIGKTSFLLDMCEQLGITVVYIPAALTAPEDLTVPAPHDDPDTGQKVLDFLLNSELTAPGQKVLVIDELARAPKQVQNQLLELVQNRRLADIPIPDLVGVFSADNDGKEYSGLQGSADLAQADRWATITVDVNGSPWRRALAAKYADTDLTGVFRHYASLPKRIKEVLNPRKLDHVIYNLLRGHPGIWGLAIVAGERQRLIDEAGADLTDEVLDKIASALGTTNRDRLEDPVAAAFKAAMADGVNLFIEGAPGTGKTAYLRDQIEQAGAEMVYFSAPVTSPDSLLVPMPNSDGELDTLVYKSLVTDTGRPKVLMVDEVWRGSKQTRNALMEPFQQGTIAGQAIPGLVACVAANNPKEVSGYKLDVGRPDPAQAGRFAINLSVDAADIPSFEHLLAKYGEEAEPFIEWYQHDLDANDPSRVLITRRTIERLIKLHRQGKPLEWAKPFLNGEHAPVSLIDLETRLANRPVARLRYIAQHSDWYAEQLGQGEDVDPARHDEVYAAFSKAELSQLTEQREVCVKLYALLKQQYRFALLRRGGDRQQFWYHVLRDGSDQG